MSTIETYLKSCRELACFCSQNGWIDNDSLHFTIMLETTREAFVEVEFEEVLMKASGQTYRQSYLLWPITSLHG